MLMYSVFILPFVDIKVHYEKMICLKIRLYLPSCLGQNRVKVPLHSSSQAAMCALREVDALHFALLNVKQESCEFLVSYSSV